MEFEWHPAKAKSNLEKHGVSFEEAQAVFDDPLQMHYPDDAHSIGEQRFICFGLSERGRVLAVIYTEQSENRIRIISAREATSREEQAYETQSDLT
jgi:uncharacterized DUF497 family protein